MIELNDKKKSFKELLKGLYQYNYVLPIFIISTLLFLFSILFIFSFLLSSIFFTPIFNIYVASEFVLILITIFIFSLIPIIVFKILNKDNNRKIVRKDSSIKEIIENLSSMNLFENENEKKILKSNLKSLYIFKKIYDYKYCMIAMGSIIEFLLVRYCNKNNIEPEPYTSPDGSIIPAGKKHFCNYIQSAIKYDILGQKNSWYLIQNNLRQFRNYIHISKEIKEEEIDYDWYISTKGVFNRIIRNFK
ncbi:MAG: hypothetical protein CEE43_02200 [Promethearchaeota archaeon Loki_b32]|nr:MAG: hypothetical protein CEE43_02200 [Candidatus Lokiarchaeota archaeon Loki_b32]